MPRGGARPGAGRKPGGKALAKATIIRAKQAPRPKQATGEKLDSLEVMHGCMTMAYHDIPDALQQVRELCGPPAEGEKDRDPKALLEAVIAFKNILVATFSMAKEIAPFEHPKLSNTNAGKDENAGPKYLNLKAIEQAF